MGRPLKETITDPSFILKLIELALVATGMGIMIGKDTRYCVNGNGEYILFNLAFTAYVVVIFGIILIMIFDQATNFTVAVFLILGAIFNLGAGVLGFLDYAHITEGGTLCIVLAIFALINGIVMIVDTSVLVFLGMGSCIALVVGILSFVNYGTLREGGDYCFTIGLLAFTNTPLMLLDAVIHCRK